MTSYMQTSVAASSFLGGTEKQCTPHLLGALISHQRSGSLSVLHNNLAVPSAIQKTVFNHTKCVLKAELRVLNRGNSLVLLSSVFSKTGLNVDSVTCSLNSILCSGWNMVEEFCTFMFSFTFPGIKPSGVNSAVDVTPGQTSQTTFPGAAGATPHASGSRPPFVLMTMWITVVFLFIHHHFDGHHLLVCIVTSSTGVDSQLKFVRFVHLIVIGYCSPNCIKNRLHMLKNLHIQCGECNSLPIP